MCIRDSYSNLLEAVQYYLAKDYDNSAKSLEKVDGKMKMESASFTSVYKSLSDQLSSRVENSAFDAGMSAYESADYETAITQFTKCIEANKNNVKAIYYLAYAYNRQGDTTNSNKYFKKIVDDFGDSEYADRARNLSVSYTHLDVYKRQLCHSFWHNSEKAGYNIFHR